MESGRVDWVLILGLLLTVAALVVVGRRVTFLYRLIANGQPAPDRIEHVREHIGQGIKSQVVEVFGQKKLLKWTVPGAAHFFVFWAFVILATVYLEAYGALFDPHFAIPLIGHWAVLGFLQDFIAVMALVSIAVFAAIRFKNSPERLGRKSRFEGSHLGGAWATLVMIFNVIWTLFLFRGAASAEGHLPYKSGAVVSIGIGKLLEPMSADALGLLEDIGLLLHIGVMLVFAILVVHSKHLHIFVAPINVLFGRKPVALGAMKPLMVEGKPFDMEMVESMDEETSIGIGKVDDFSWKGMLDFATCTECGRCQDQCPAWNTDKPLSPKMLILNLRDHAFAKAPYMLASSDEEREKLPASVLAEADRPLVGETEGLAWHPSGGAVIDNDVLWSCVSCGACVNQCPVDIEHVDHIMDMRRYQVLIEGSFPAELNGLFRGLENKGNPWNMSQNARMEWAQGLDFEVKQVGEDIDSLDEVEWLFWVGCAGAYEDRAKKTTRAVAELLHMADVSFAVLGNGETCTGDPARRAGNEFVFQQLAMQNAETLKGSKAKKVVSTCAHCFNTLKNEYSSFGVELEVVHHTQLLNRLVREGRLTPVPQNGGPTRSVTYHDPCYIGRHNGVYEPPRELLEVLPSTEFREMERSGERSFCCGAGGARMWMEESIGERINVNRTTEAVGTGADAIAVGCPFCRVMLSDGLTALQSEGKAREEVEVLDVAQMLLASVKRGDVTEAPTGDAEADDAQYASTVAHDGTMDPEQAPAVAGTARAAKSPDREADKPLDEPSSWEPEADSKAPQHAGDTEPGLTPEQSSLGKEPGEGAPSDGQPVRDGEKLWQREEEELTPEAREELKAELKDELRAELLAELRGEGGGSATATTTPAPPKAAPEPTPEPEAKPEAEPEPKAEPKLEAKAEEKKDDGGDPPPMLIGSL
jgi:Fe-S oxidoreductase